MLSLNITGPASASARSSRARPVTTTPTAATVVSTDGDATLSVIDSDERRPGHLTNGTFALPQALQLRATNAANPNTAYQPLSEAGTPVKLLTYRARPRPGPVTLGFRQSIGASRAAARRHVQEDADLHAVDLAAYDFRR